MQSMKYLPANYQNAGQISKLVNQSISELSSEGQLAGKLCGRFWNHYSLIIISYMFLMFFLSENYHGRRKNILMSKKDFDGSPTFYFTSSVYGIFFYQKRIYGRAFIYDYQHSVCYVIVICTC